MTRHWDEEKRDSSELSIKSKNKKSSLMDELNDNHYKNIQFAG